MISATFSRRAISTSLRVLARVFALWLGHERVETTQIYLEATLAMMRRFR
jgi:hypothetical protein